MLRALFGELIFCKEEGLQKIKVFPFSKIDGL